MQFIELHVVNVGKQSMIFSLENEQAFLHAIKKQSIHNSYFVYVHKTFVSLYKKISYIGNFNFIVIHTHIHHSNFQWRVHTKAFKAHVARMHCVVIIVIAATLTLFSFYNVTCYTNTHVTRRPLHVNTTKLLNIITCTLVATSVTLRSFACFFFLSSFLPKTEQQQRRLSKVVVWCVASNGRKKEWRGHKFDGPLESKWVGGAHGTTSASCPLGDGEEYLKYLIYAPSWYPGIHWILVFGRILITLSYGVLLLGRPRSRQLSP